jgi:hypothetical protein
MFRREARLECPPLRRKQPSGAFVTAEWPHGLFISLGHARPEFVLCSDFCTMDNFSQSFHAEGAGRRSHTSLDACWSSRPMLRTRSQHEQKCRKGTETVPILRQWMRELIDLALVAAAAKTRGGRQNSPIDDALSLRDGTLLEDSRHMLKPPCGTPARAERSLVQCRGNASHRVAALA